MAKLWTKSGAAEALDKAVERFCFEKDVALDAHLVKYDVIGSVAHAKMLEKIGVLNAEEFKTLQNTLVAQWESFEKGEWSIAVEDEDVHTAIEARLGEVGEKLHTARSRNDQVLTDMRLYGKDGILSISTSMLELAEIMRANAEKYEFVPMPGYTHLQRAMPTSYGMWLGSFVEALLDVSRELELSWDLFDQSPLGSGAGYGVSLDIDRAFTAECLGFSKVQRNSIYCQNSRGHFESVFICSLTSLMSVIGRLASDVCLYCSEEFKFLKLPDRFFTGSSIMPQKKNPDLFELLRSKVMVMASLETRVRNVTHGITSGYSKDLQEVKPPVMEAIELASDSLAVLLAVMGELEPNQEKLKVSMTSELFAAHAAYEMVKNGVPFRQAYRDVKKDLGQLDKMSADDTIKNMKHIGATAGLELDKTQKEIQSAQGMWDKKAEHLYACWDKLLKLGK